MNTAKIGDIDGISFQTVNRPKTIGLVAGLGFQLSRYYARRCTVWGVALYHPAVAFRDAISKGAICPFGTKFDPNCRVRQICRRVPEISSRGIPNLIRPSPAFKWAFVRFAGAGVS